MIDLRLPNTVPIVVEEDALVEICAKKPSRIVAPRFSNTSTTTTD
ncbi:hypothetical protein [Bradyrhizobium sp. Ash2021]|nr:hypothetical protein [Bradyrhizobium sp. Ash2021]